jgi:kynurenine formamidase
MLGMEPLPTYDELPLLSDLGLRHAWGVFGEGDVLGTVNLLTPERVRAAATLIESGEVISLDLPLDQPDPPLFGRQPYRHEVFAINRNEMDDRIDHFHPQGSTQWDGLGHVRCREYGYWGGRTADPTAGSNPLGIEHLAAHGIVGRGVLVDVAGWAQTHGSPLTPLASTEITRYELCAAMRSQGVELRPGDILCVRTGWLDAYRHLDGAARRRFADHPASIGLRADEDMARLIWDSHVAALCCDNPAIERPLGDPAVGSLHRRLLPLLGVALGELFDFELLSQRCRERERHEFFFAAVPLKLPGGLGSPGNAIALV